MIEILSLNDRRWDYYISMLPLKKQDIYFTRRYYKMYEVNKDGIAKCFVYSEGKSIALYPFMVNEVTGYDLNEKHYDIETAYGYGGPLTNCEDENFLENFEMEFLKFCQLKNIVAEFIRFHPIIQDENIFKKNISVIENRKTVCVDLDKDINDIWMNDIKTKNRNMIRRAVKEGLKVEIINDYDTFRQIYIETMKKLNAGSYYYFSEQYFNEMKKNKNFNIFCVKKEDKVIASAIVMSYGENIHYHLAGSLEKYLKFFPNNLLLWEIINYGNENKFKKLHLGGGTTNNDLDKLFKFKSSFSRDTLSFYIGKRIHNKKVYDYLINEWEKKNNKEAKLFLQYKL